MMGSFFLIMSKTLAKPPFTNCALRSSRLATQAMTTSVKCGRDLDRMFEEGGASRLLARVDNDVDFEEALGSWREAVVMAIQDTVTV